MSILSKIIKSSFFLLLASSVGKLAVFLVGIFAARMLSQESFGQFSSIRNTITSIGALFSGSVSSTSTKTIAENDGNHKELLIIVYSVFTVNVIFALLSILFIIIFSDWIINNFFVQSLDMKSALNLSGLLLLATNMSVMTQSFLVGFERFKSLAIISIVVSITSIPVIYLLITKYEMFGALFGLIWFYSFDFLLKAILVYNKLKPISIKINICLILSGVKKVLALNYQLFITTVIVSFSFWYARIILINDTSGFTSIAVFDAAYQWLTVVMLITGATTSVALSSMAKVNKDASKMKDVFIINLVVNLFVSIFIAILFIFFSEKIMSIYGQEYMSGKNTLVILSITSVFFTLATLFNRYMIAKSKLNTILFVTVMSSISLFMCLNFFISFREVGLATSILGYYITSVVIYIIIMVLDTYHVKR